jgi:hypothetical protein
MRVSAHEYLAAVSRRRIISNNNTTWTQPEGRNIEGISQELFERNSLGSREKITLDSLIGPRF